MIIQDKPFAMQVGKTMQELFRVLKKRTGEQTEAKISIEQFVLLYRINLEQDEVIQNDMAGIMGKDKSSILRMIDCLENKDLVRRVVNINDRRKNHIMVTKKGERVINQHLETELELMKELQEGLTENDMEMFYKVLNHIRNNAEKR
jgi:MarR family transcriptional regulator, transcriptional regulator for hemolysin